VRTQSSAELPICDTPGIREPVPNATTEHSADLVVLRA
jgi:hypothetical protein